MPNRGPLAAIPRRLTPVAALATILLMAAALTGAHAAAAVTARAGAASASTSPHTWAYEPVTARKVTVAKPTGSTPVHPENLTHPQLDDMNVVTAAHSKPGAATAAAAVAAAARLPGIDVSAYQGDINWASVGSSVDFVYAKATEGTSYTSPDFSNQSQGPSGQAIIRGAYHFAIPGNSTGSAQADYFVRHGGGWSPGGKMLPGALDIEYNPYGSECYGLTHSQMTSWVRGFVNEYAYDTHVYPVIYSTFDWWNKCTGNAGGFQTYDPLWIACYCSSAGTLPAGYATDTFWQYADSGSLPGDQDIFNGTYARLQALADG